MKTASVRQLRNNFSQIARWLKDGEQVVITMRKKVIARMIPEPSAERTLRMPDFAARIREEYPHPRISEEELRNALYLAVFRKQISEATLAAAWQIVELDIKNGIYVEAPIGQVDLHEKAAHLAQKYTF